MAHLKRPLAGLRCLVLDDEMLIALDIQQILETAGAAAVVCAGNAAEALAALREKPDFDLAVLDFILSGAVASSLTVASALIDRKIPFVFLTGMRADDLRHTTRFPKVPVVEKPYEAAQLLEAIARVLLTRPSR